jgi:hypothetical protein
VVRPGHRHGLQPAAGDAGGADGDRGAARDRQLLPPIEAQAPQLKQDFREFFTPDRASRFIESRSLHVDIVEAHQVAQPA